MTWCSVHIKYEFLTKQCCHRKIIVGVKMDIPLCQEWCGCYFGYERCINGKNIFVGEKMWKGWSLEVDVFISTFGRH